MATRAKPSVRWRNDRIFFSGMALVMLLLVFIGFSQTFYLSRWTGAPSLTPILYFHGLLFSGWIVFQAVQPGLVAARKAHIHRKTGWFGAALAAAVLATGIAVAVMALRRGHAPFGSAESFFAVPMADMASFTIFVAAGIAKRRDSDAHKRLMLLATMSMLPAALARFPGIGFLEGPPLLVLLTGPILIAAGIGYDKISRGRIHRVWLWGGGAFLLMQAAKIPVGQTELWQSFARSLL